MISTSKTLKRTVYAFIVLAMLPSCFAIVGPAPTDVAPLLVQSGDLPNGMTGGEIEATEAATDTSFRWGQQPRPLLQLQQTIKGGALPFVPEGRVMVWHFRNAKQAAAAYTSHAVMLSPEPAFNGIGEQSAHYNNLNGTLLDREYISLGHAILFTRCTVLVEVHLRMAVQEISADTTPLTEAMATYARRLDQRLSSQVC
jgi:hypothetical protein